MSPFDENSEYVLHVLATTKPLLREREAVAFMEDKFGFSISPHTLTTLRCRGGGPEWRRAGKWPVYEPRSLIAYMRARTSAPLDRVRDLEAA